MHTLMALIFTCFIQAADIMPPKAQAEIDISNRTVIEVKQTLIKKLTPILAETTKKGDLEGAVTLKKYIDSIQEDIKSQTGDLLGTTIKVDGKWRTSRGYMATIKDGKIAYSDGNVGDAIVNGTKVSFVLKGHWQGTISFDVKGDGPYPCTENGVANVYTMERLKD